MKNKDFESLGRQLLPFLPGFALKSPLVVMPPVTEMLRGLCFESHSFDKNLFYVWVVVMPLCVPTKHLIFNLGKRIDGPDGGPWDRSDGQLLQFLAKALETEALPMLSSIKTLPDLARSARSLPSAHDPYVKQAIAYSLARAGETDDAIMELGELSQRLDLQVPWQREMAERAMALATELADRPSDAQRRLATWESESSRQLGLV